MPDFTTPLDRWRTAEPSYREAVLFVLLEHAAQRAQTAERSESVGLSTLADRQAALSRVFGDAARILKRLVEVEP